MAVYTEVSLDEAGALLRELGLGPLEHMEGCHGGIENTNYFVTTAQGKFVLTVFERLGFEQLPFYLKLMKHLALRGIAVPNPAADARAGLLHTLQGKPAAVVNRLPGSSELLPAVAHCAAVGAALARMHLAGRDFALEQPNLRALPWWNETAPAVLPFLDAGQQALLRSELAYQNHVQAQSLYRALPRGPIHADLFRDNVLFAGTREAPRLSGLFDFYFAGIDTWLFDLAVTMNDWCIDLDSGAREPQRSRALLQAYHVLRPLSAAERALLGAMQRGGALRFWLSRLWDLHLPRQATLLKAHDPAHFERVLRQCVARTDSRLQDTDRVLDAV